MSDGACLLDPHIYGVPIEVFHRHTEARGIVRLQGWVIGLGLEWRVSGLLRVSGLGVRLALRYHERAEHPLHLPEHRRIQLGLASGS